MNRQKTSLVMAAASKALKPLEEQFGVKVSYKGGRFDGDLCRLKFEFAEVRKDGTVLSEDAKAYMELATLYGLPKDGLGKEFSCSGKTYVVCGFRPRSRQSVIGARKPDGKKFKFSPSIAFGMNVGLKAMEASMTDRDFEEDRINRAEARGS
jgi:hypothetical protein